MFLKSVELLGFKSFADRSRIDFQEGISAILGPNGCGKSNILDAIKWVIGEQSSKTLRAGKMEDVIFNGTENRKALNVAEVTLILSNTDGILPLDLPEVSIKRRLYRSGESEYFVNQHPVRLKEVRDMFLDTGIGKSAYSVMEQGKIDQILSNKPQDRRYIFEEAAGISKYKVRGQEAEKKLEKTEENLRQINGILNEVKRSYETLKRQSDNTTEFRKLKESLFELERDIQLLILKEKLAKKDVMEDDLKSKSERKSYAQKEIDNLNMSMEEGIDSVNTMESELINRQKNLYRIDSEKNKKDSQIKIQTERISEFEKRINEDLAKQKLTKEKILLFRKEIEQKQAALAEGVNSKQELVKNIEGFNRDILLFNDKIKNNERQFGENELKIREKEKDIEEHREKLRLITDDIVTQLDTRLKEMGYSYKERHASENRIDEIIKALTIVLQGKLNLLTDAAALGNTQGEGLGKTVKDLQEKLEQALPILGELKELFAQYKNSTPAFLDEFLAPKGIITKKREIDQNINNAYEGISMLKKENDRLRKDNRELNLKIDEYRKTLEELRVNRAKLEAQLVSMQDILKRLEREISEQSKILKSCEEEIHTGNLKITALKKEIQQLEQEFTVFDNQEKELKKSLTDLEKEITTKNVTLMDKEKKLKKEMDQLVKFQEQVEKVNINLAEQKADIRNIYQNFSEKHSRDLSEYESQMFSIKTPLAELKNHLAKINDKIKDLGQVNLMAPEEFAEVKERYDFLNSQIDDLKKSKENLKRITEEIKKESEELFLQTYNQIKKNFHVMYRRLFGGGRAEIKLLEPDNVLESGIEIMAQPPGKKLESISLLSGGEKSLTGVALLFATFLVKPSPFCILDEIDAALDDANVERFVNLLFEFSQKSQFVVISHNKKTVANANTLLGITMEESGVSKIVAVKVKGNDGIQN